MTEKYLSIQEIESQLHIPNTTVRRYIKLFHKHIEVTKKGNQYFIKESSLEILERIRKLYEDGKTQNEIYFILKRGEKLPLESGRRGESLATNDEAMLLLHSIDTKQTEIIAELINHNKRMVDSKDQTIIMLQKQLEYERERRKQIEAIILADKEAAATRGERLADKKTIWRRLFPYLF